MLYICALKRKFEKKNQQNSVWFTYIDILLNVFVMMRSASVRINPHSSAPAFLNVLKFVDNDPPVGIWLFVLFAAYRSVLLGRHVFLSHFEELLKEKAFCFSVLKVMQSTF